MFSHEYKCDICRIRYASSDRPIIDEGTPPEDGLGRVCRQACRDAKAQQAYLITYMETRKPNV